jgi:hypothetical protein
MLLLQLAEIQSDPEDVVFRTSPARGAILAVGVIGACAALALAGWAKRVVALEVSAGTVFLVALLMRRFVFARFRPTNWLVRATRDGLFIQFRSYLNYHLPSHDRSVAFVPYGEIRSARLVRESSTVRSPSGSRATRTRRLAELELASDTAPLAKALSDEMARPAPIESTWYGKASTLYRDYPVQMVSPTALQVNWTVAPGVSRFLELMRDHTAVAEPVELTQDFLSLQGLPREDQERLLRRLVEAGRTITAIYLVRRLYCCDLTHAKSIVDGLAQRSPA